MSRSTSTLHRIADWLLALPVPDPDLQCELLGWAMGLMWLAQGIERWRAS